MNHRVANLRLWIGRVLCIVLRRIGHALEVEGHNSYYWSTRGQTVCPKCHEVIHLENWSCHRHFGCHHPAAGGGTDV